MVRYVFLRPLRPELKGDTAALPVFLVNDKNRTDLNFSHLFCKVGLKISGPQQCQLLHVEKDQREKHPESIFVQNISEKLIFCWLGLVFITPVFTIFVLFLSFTKKTGRGITL
jgi:hypothetical protein